MNITAYRVIQAFSIVVLLVAEACLSFVVFWLSHGGVIGCGRGVFDEPNWPVTILPLVGVPFLFICGAVVLFLGCSSGVTRCREQRPDSFFSE